MRENMLEIEYIKTCDINYIIACLNKLCDSSHDNYVGNFGGIKYFMIISEDNILCTQENIESIVDNLINQNVTNKYKIPDLYSAKNVYELLIKLINDKIIDIVKFVNNMCKDFTLWSDVFVHIYELLINVSMDNLFINLENTNDFYGLIECSLCIK